MDGAGPGQGHGYGHAQGARILGIERGQYRGLGGFGLGQIVQPQQYLHAAGGGLHGRGVVHVLVGRHGHQLVMLAGAVACQRAYAQLNAHAVAFVGFARQAGHAIERAFVVEV